MKVRLVCDHPGEGRFPDFKKGTRVAVKDECARFRRWYACDIEEYRTYVPDVFICEGKLTRDYNPTELTLSKGDIVCVREIVYTWLLAENDRGETGWIPAESVVSADG